MATISSLWNVTIRWIQQFRSHRDLSSSMGCDDSGYWWLGDKILDSVTSTSDMGESTVLRRSGAPSKKSILPFAGVAGDIWSCQVLYSSVWIKGLSLAFWLLIMLSGLGRRSRLFLICRTPGWVWVFLGIMDFVFNKTRSNMRLDTYQSIFP